MTEVYEEIFFEDQDGKQIFEDDGVTPVSIKLTEGQYQTLWVRAKEEGKEIDEIIVETLREFVASAQDNTDD